MDIRSFQKSKEYKKVNQLIANCWHPITGFKYNKKKGHLEYHKSPKKMNDKQREVLFKARSVRSKHNPTKEELEWLENYKKNRDDILKALEY